MLAWRLTGGRPDQRPPRLSTRARNQTKTKTKQKKTHIELLGRKGPSTAWGATLKMERPRLRCQSTGPCDQLEFRTDSVDESMRYKPYRWHGCLGMICDSYLSRDPSPNQPAAGVGLASAAAFAEGVRTRPVRPLAPVLLHAHSRQ